MFEKSKKGDEVSILFPRVLEIDAKYDYSKEPDKVFNDIKKEIDKLL